MTSRGPDRPVIAPRLEPRTRTTVDPRFVGLFDEIATTRGGMPMSFRVFLNSPEAAAAIAAFGQHVRWGSVLDNRSLEIVCMRVATVLEDRFMWSHHAVLARDAGLSEEEIAALASPRDFRSPNAADRTLVAFVDAELRYEMTDELFNALAGDRGPAGTMEAALATGYYAMLHILFTTLRLDSDVDTRVPLDQERAAEARVRS